MMLTQLVQGDRSAINFTKNNKMSPSGFTLQDYIGFVEQPCAPRLESRKVTPMSDFAQLLETEIPRLRRYARALTRDPSRADDLVQSCLVRAIAKAHLWQPGTDLRAWLFTILHNQHVNDIRRSVREGASVPVEEIGATLTVAPNAVASLQLRDLERAIATLPVEQRQVILFVGLEGMSYEKVAAILRVPIGTVRSRLSRGRETLRRRMGMRGGIMPDAPRKRANVGAASQAA
jgi:RNA polymerase sigma-70 factor (ECF subfamily)